MVSMLWRILLPVVILGVGALVMWRVGQPLEPPTPEHRPAQRLKTEVTQLHSGPYQVTLESQGVVRAHHETTLTPLVGGTVVRIADCFEDGAFFAEGEVLVELDAADFSAAVATAESSLARAQAAIAQEEARAKQARRNWEDLGYTEEPSDLVLRIPQLKEAQANLDAARAQLDQARRDLERTKVRAPFAGRVRQRLIGLGQSVGAATPLGEIFAIDYAEIRLPLTPEQLGFIDLPSRSGDDPVPVTLTDALGERDDPDTWQARIVRTEGTLDEASRELFAIARIDDPFGVGSGTPPLRIGQPVRASIEGVRLDDVFVIPRQALRGINLVYLVTDELTEAMLERFAERDEEPPVGPVIRRTPIDPVWATADVLVVREGLENGDRLSTTRLPYAPNGAPVDIIETPTSAANDKGDEES